MLVQEKEGEEDGEEEKITSQLTILLNLLVRAPVIVVNPGVTTTMNVAY